nr:putative reverse transcriptase domain-containing protein [Tanacetum cinerariifolium]GEX52982.1 putative reverse transcriptase domain-containing protein [Tanacetum cinerariifolium]
MPIKKANKSMQSPKGMIQNVLVKIDKFRFPMDFVIVDIVEDDKVPIILGRPMLDVFRKKISLEVESEKVVFKANEVLPPLSVPSICAINNLQVPNAFGIQEDLEDFLMNSDFNGDLGDFLELNCRVC